MNFPGAEQDTGRITTLKERSSSVVQPIPRNLLRAGRNEIMPTAIGRIGRIKINAITADDQINLSADINVDIKSSTRADESIIAPQNAFEDKRIYKWDDRIHQTIEGQPGLRTGLVEENVVGWLCK